jgi:hypothetical protein
MDSRSKRLQGQPGLGPNLLHRTASEGRAVHGKNAINKQGPSTSSSSSTSTTFRE